MSPFNIWMEFSFGDRDGELYLFHFLIDSSFIEYSKVRRPCYQLNP